MNSLLLETPIYINRMYIAITGELEAGIFLDYLFKKFSAFKNNTIELYYQTIYNELYFYNCEVKKINKKLNELPFLDIKENNEASCLYVLDPQKYELYLLGESA